MHWNAKKKKKLFLLLRNDFIRVVAIICKTFQCKTFVIVRLAPLIAAGCKI